MKAVAWTLMLALPALIVAAPAQAADIVVQSPAMVTGETVPPVYTPDGRNLSPPLEWQNLPAGTKEIAVVCADFGAGSPGPWVHWLIYGIPATLRGLPEGLPIRSSDPMPRELEGAIQGNNGWGLPLYRGPAPPPGKPHLYYFTVYALDEELGLPAGLDRDELLEAMQGHVLGRGDLVPIYERF